MTPERRPWLASEFNRNTLSTSIAAAVFAVFVSLGGERAASLTWRTLYASRVMQAFWGFWAAYALCAAGTTWLAFRRLRGPALRDAVLHGDDQGPDWLRRLLRNRVARSLLVGGSTHVMALATSLTSLLLMTLLLALKTLGRMSAAMIAVGIAATAASWLYLWMVHAVQYAREDMRAPGLDFPGGHEREFSDYVYASLAGQVTFGTTDVAVTSPAMRRTVTTHGLIAFVFNTVILAILVSLLVG